MGPRTFTSDDDRYLYGWVGGELSVKVLAEHGFKVAKGIIEEGRDLQPVFLVIGPGGQFARLPVGWGGGAEKEAVFAAVRHTLRTVGAKAYVFISEAWVSKAPKDGPLPDLPPSEDPNRSEILMVEGNDTSGNAVWISAEITRNSDGVGKVGEPEKDITIDTKIGRAVNFLKLPEEGGGKTHN